MGRLRLVVNLKGGPSVVSATQRLDGRKFAATIVNNVGIEYSEKRWDELRTTIQAQIREDVLYEIENIARQYRGLIIGAQAKRASRGTIHSSMLNGPQMALPNRPWAALSEPYLKWKRSKGKSEGHFKLDGTLKSAMARSETWIGLFGGVSVRLRRRNAGNKANAIGTIIAPGKKKVFSIASVEVVALNRINAANLAALNVVGGRQASIGFGENAGPLASIVYEKKPELGYRLFGNRKTVPYRSTLEPFLGFVLTRAIPAAVKERVRRLIEKDKSGIDRRVARIR